MTLVYTDLLGDGKTHRIKATITTDHPASSYNQPVIVLEDGNGLNWESLVLLQYRVIKATRKELELLNRIIPIIQQSTGYTLPIEAPNA
jgi:hypothetical protein